MRGELDPDGVEAQLGNDCWCKPENVDLFYILGRISPWRKRLITEMWIFGERLFLIQFPRAVGKHFVYGTQAIESYFRTFKLWMLMAHCCESVEVRINLIMVTVLGGKTGVGKAGEAWFQIFSVSDKKTGNVYDDYKVKAVSQEQNHCVWFSANILLLIWNWKLKQVETSLEYCNEVTRFFSLNLKVNTPNFNHTLHFLGPNFPTRFIQVENYYFL